MSKLDVLKLFREVGGFLTKSHFVYTSGRHGDSYLNKDALYPYPEKISLLGQKIAEKFKKRKIEAVVAPALGGIILSQWTAYYFQKLTGRKVLALYTEKIPEEKAVGGNNQVFRRGYGNLVKGKKVLVVEDIVTTGGSIKKVIKSIQNSGGKVVAVCALVNRNPENVGEKTFGVPFFSLAKIKMRSWEESECPLCRKKIAINQEVGKGREYLEKKQRRKKID